MIGHGLSHITDIWSRSSQHTVSNLCLGLSQRFPTCQTHPSSMDWVMVPGLDHHISRDVESRRSPKMGSKALAPPKDKLSSHFEEEEHLL
jgi:hypothetical protein